MRRKSTAVLLGFAVGLALAACGEEEPCLGETKEVTVLMPITVGKVTTFTPITTTECIQ